MKILRTTEDIADYDYSWFILDQSIIKKEFALSGSEQNPDITNRDLKLMLQTRLGGGAPGPVEDFKPHGEDSIVTDTLEELVRGMNELTGDNLLNFEGIERQVCARDHEITNLYSKDVQVMSIRNSRRYIGDKLVRVGKPHKLLDPRHGPLIAVRLWTVTRKNPRWYSDQPRRAGI